MKVGEYTWEAYVGTILGLIRQFDVKRFVEIGVLQGRLAWDILKANVVSEYYLVDPWRVYPGHPRVTEEGWDKMATRVYLQAAGYRAARVIRLPSTQACWLFEPGTVDAVYVDGDHRYNAMKADVQAWVPRLRVGGVLLGHDYESFPSQVGKCVDDLFGKAFNYVSQGDIWWITKEGAQHAMSTNRS